MPSCNTAAKVQAAAAMGMLKRGREEPPHVRGQGQKPGGPHARRVAAKRSYPTSEVRGSGRECQAVKAQEQLRGAVPHLRSGGRLRGATLLPRSEAAMRGVTQHPRSGAAAGRSCPTPTSPRPGAAVGRSNPTPPRPRPGVAAGRTNPMPEARGSGQEDQPHVQEAVAARAQEGLEELSHVEGQEGQR